MENFNASDLSSVVQTERHQVKTTDKYQFLSTSKVLSQLAENGWHVIGGNQTKVRDTSREGYQKHALKLENQALNSLLPTVGKPQMLLRNSHEGSSSLQLLTAFHIFVCSNGAVAHSGDLADIRVLHRAFTEEALQEAIQGFTQRVPKMLEQVEEWHGVGLTDAEQRLLAQQAIELRFDPITDSFGLPTKSFPVAPEQALRSRRYGEQPKNLWNAFNNLQENLVEKGGLRGARNANNRRIPVRAVKAVDANIKLNKGLWALAQGMADLKLGRLQLPLNFH